MVKSLGRFVSIMLVTYSLTSCSDTPFSHTSTKDKRIETSDTLSKMNEKPKSTFEWHIQNVESTDSLTEGFSIVAFTYNNKYYFLDTIYTRVSPCGETESTNPHPCLGANDPDDLGSYIGLDTEVFCEGQIVDRGDSLWYIYSFAIEDEEADDPAIESRMIAK